MKQYCAIPSHGCSSQLHYDSENIRSLYRLAWGPSIHFGLYLSGQETIEEAALNTKHAIANAVEISSRDRILEVGAGEGETARWLAALYKCKVIASNLALEQTKKGHGTTEIEHLEGLIKHVCADYQHLPFRNAEFTIHLCQEAFVHCSDKHRYFQEAFRVLRAGGRLALSEQTTNRALCNETLRHIITKRHGPADMWSADEMADAADKAGFVNVTTTDWSGHMARHFDMIVRRIETNLDQFAQQVAPEILEENLNLWRLAVETAETGKIGWCLLTARKPD